MEAMHSERVRVGVGWSGEGGQTAHRWKGVGEARCSGCHVPGSCTVLPKTDLDQNSEPA